MKTMHLFAALALTVSGAAFAAGEHGHDHQRGQGHVQGGGRHQGSGAGEPGRPQNRECALCRQVTRGRTERLGSPDLHQRTGFGF